MVWSWGGKNITRTHHNVTLYESFLSCFKGQCIEHTLSYWSVFSELTPVRHVDGVLSLWIDKILLILTRRRQNAGSRLRHIREYWPYCILNLAVTIGWPAVWISTRFNDNLAVCHVWMCNLNNVSQTSPRLFHFKQRRHVITLPKRGLRCATVLTRGSTFGKWAGVSIPEVTGCDLDDRT